MGAAKNHGDWVLHRGVGDIGVGIYVPPMLAAEIAAEAEREFEERIMAARAAAQVAEDARKAATASDRAAPDANQSKDLAASHRAHPFEISRHAVFPNVNMIAERLENHRRGVFGDKEQTAREVTALTRALEYGAERSIALRPDWSTALQSLVEEMPAFRPAIELLRGAFAIANAGGVKTPPVQPMLLLGPPGTGKSFFCRRLQEVMGCGSGWMAMDQPTAGDRLRGTDRTWWSARIGLLFELLGLGSTANPIIVVDEIDKAARSFGSRDVDALAQFYGALEPETARHLMDASLDVEMDASLVTYVATANSLAGLDAALLSRFSVVEIGLPKLAEVRDATHRIVQSTLARLGLDKCLSVSGGAIALLSNYSARVVVKAVEKAAGLAVSASRNQLGHIDMECALGIADQTAASSNVLH